MTTPKPWDRDDDARRARIPVRHRDPSRPPDEGDDSLAVATDDSDADDSTRPPSAEAARAGEPVTDRAAVDDAAGTDDEDVAAEAPRSAHKPTA